MPRIGVLRSPVAAAAAAVFLFIATAAFASPWICRHPYDAQNLERASERPSGSHWMGTDVLGRDLFARILRGGRTSLTVGIIATVVAVGIGVSWGAVAGYAGGRTDHLMMRLVDILYSLPTVFYVILAMVVFGQKPAVLFLALGGISWLTMSRIVRGEVLRLKEREFVEAARAIGAGGRRILLRHILPQLVGPVTACAALTLPSVVLLEAFLSFLGLGVRPPEPSWGSLCADGAVSMAEYPWQILFPAGVMTGTLLSLNVAGDGLGKPEIKV
ncbi:MAG: ABC transporter permease [Planctomycetota bacterium]